MINIVIPLTSMDGSEEFLEKSLDRMKGVFCLPYEIEVVLPRSCFKRCPESVAELERKMFQLFGGVTRVNGVGTWKDAKGNPIVEPIAIIKSSHSCTTDSDMKEWIEAVGEAGKMSKQDAVFVKSGKAWIVPPGHLVAGKEVKATIHEP